MKISYKAGLLCALFSLLFSPAFAVADGIYVTKDLKHALGEHVTIKLSQKQTINVERQRTVELTDDQLKPLTNFYSKVPKTLPVLSSRWDSCTCGLGVYAIWCRPGELDIPYSSLTAQMNLDECLEKKGKDEKNAEGEMEGLVSDKLILDSKGHMFISGHIVTMEEMYNVIDNISRDQKLKKVCHSVYLDVPPPINPEIDLKIKQISRRLSEYARKKDVNLWGSGLDPK